MWLLIKESIQVHNPSLPKTVWWFVYGNQLKIQGTYCITAHSKTEKGTMQWQVPQNFSVTVSMRSVYAEEWKLVMSHLRSYNYNHNWSWGYPHLLPFLKWSYPNPTSLDFWNYEELKYKVEVVLRSQAKDSWIPTTVHSFALRWRSTALY